MYNETQLAAIRLFGDKTLSFGCIYSHKGSYYKFDGSNYRLKEIGSGYHLYIDSFCNCPREISKIYNPYKDEGRVEILGHEPHLHDLFRVAEEKGIGVWQSMGTFMRDGLYFYKDQDPILKLYKYNPTLPLLSQPNLDQIVNLFQ